MAGVEAQRLLHHPDCFFWPAREVQRLRLPCIAVRIVGIEGNGPFTFGQGLVIPAILILTIAFPPRLRETSETLANERLLDEQSVPVHRISAGAACRDRHVSRCPQRQEQALHRTRWGPGCLCGLLYSESVLFGVSAGYDQAPRPKQRPHTLWPHGDSL